MTKETTSTPAGKVHEPDKKKKDEASKGIKETHEQANDTLTEGTADKEKEKDE